MRYIIWETIEMVIGIGKFSVFVEGINLRVVGGVKIKEVLFIFGLIYSQLIIIGNNTP